jgi:hypothetical protein
MEESDGAAINPDVDHQGLEALINLGRTSFLRNR